jgi:hypothetical protein
MYGVAGFEFFEKFKCPETRCLITFKQNYMQKNFDALLFYITRDAKICHRKEIPNNYILQVCFCNVSTSLEIVYLKLFTAKGSLTYVLRNAILGTFRPPL